MGDKNTIEYLAYLLDKAKNQKKDKAIVFLGAGASVSAGIPLTNVIVRHIRLKFIKNPLIKNYKLNDKTDYYDLMGLLTADERRDLFHFYVTRDKVKLNIANVYLAQLLKSGYVDYIVTVNFDDLILKACTLYNFLPPVYDISNIKTITTTDVRTSSVIYLHGQYFGQWLLNNEEELAKVEQEVLSFFNSIKTRRTWIVVGYSGNDGIFEKIKSLGSFSNELFWVKKEIEDTKDSHILEFLNTPNINAHLIEGYYADSFFLKLHAELSKLNKDLNPPDVFYKPFSFLKSLILNVNDISSQDELHQEIKSIIDNCKDRIDKAIYNYEDVESIEDFKQKIVDAILKDDFRDDLAQEFKSIIKSKNFIEANITLGWYYNDWGIILKNSAQKSENENQYLESFKMYEESINLNSKNDSAYNNWGNALKDYANIKLDEKIFLESFKKYEKATTLNPKNYSAYNNWGNSIQDLANIKRDEDLYKDSIVKYQKAIEINDKIDSAYNNYGNSLLKLARIKSSELLFEESIIKFREAIKLNSKNDAAYNNLGNAIQEIAKIRANENLYYESIENYKLAISINSKNDVAYNNWGNALQELGKKSNDEKLLTSSFEKYQSSIELNSKNDSSFVNLGDSLQSLAIIKKDKKLFNKSFESYEKGIEINIKNDTAFNNLCSSLLNYYYFVDEDEKMSVLKRALEKAQIAYDLRNENSYNLACCYALMLDKKNALKFLEKSLKDKRISTSDVDKDNDWDNIRNDKDLKKLLSEFKE